MIQHNVSPAAVAAALVLVLPVTAAVAQSDTDAGNGAAEGPVDAAAVYNQGAAVIQTTREVDLTEGAQKLGWPLSGRLRPDTLWLEGDGVRLTGLSSRSNSPNNQGSGLLAARIGQPVTLLRNGSGVGGQAKTREAMLEGVNGSTVLVRVDDRIERLTPQSPWRLSWPAGDGADDGGQQGGLQLDVVADNAGTQELTATYQIDGPSWQASYTGRFDAEAGKLSLQSMAVIDNSGGAALAADKAWLVAGDVSRASGRGPRPVAMMARSEAKASDSAPEAAGDTYRYAIDGGLDVAAGATRAVSIMQPVSFDAQRSYRLESNWYTNGRDQRSHAEVRLAFKNTADVPLPAGTVRVYDAQRTAGLMGEDRIGNMPKGAPVELSLGQAFDVTGERHVVNDDKTDDGKRQRKLKITLHNAADDAARVNVIEHLPDAAKIISASADQAAENKEANTARWQLGVPAGGKTTLTYTVQWPGNR